MTGPASREALGELHSLVTKKLLEALRDGPSAEALQCARRLLADSGITGDTEADRRALRRLHKAYLSQLLRALLDIDNPPPASLLAEVGHALRAAGVQVESPTEERAVVDLASLALPFLH